MLLQLRDIEKSIGIEEILNNVSFIIEEKEKVALVGVNGAGKTSVFRLLTGEWVADGGSITKSTSLRLGYLPQMTNEEITAATRTAVDSDENLLTLYDSLDQVFDPLKKMEVEMRELEVKMANLTGLDLESALKRHDKLNTQFEEADGYEATSRLKGVLRGLGFPESQWQQPFGRLSGGERTRALLGKLLLERTDLLLLD